MSIPVYIISGFLGAGKTTLINHIVKTFSNSANIFIINDELGSFPIDDKLFDYQSGWIANLQPGHPPNAYLRELIGTLRYAAFERHPECILIELTGLAHPRTVARIVKSSAFEGHLSLGGIITVVNPTELLNTCEKLIEEQIKDANIVIVNKEDLVDKETLQYARDRIASITQEHCKILRSTYARVDTYALFTGTYSAPLVDDPIPQHFMMNITQQYTIMNFLSRDTLSCKRITTLLERYSQHILRAKGILRTDIGDKVIQCTQGKFSVLNTVRDLKFSKIVIISKADHKDTIQRDFSSIFM